MRGSVLFSPQPSQHQSARAGPWISACSDATRALSFDWEPSFCVPQASGTKRLEPSSPARL